MKEQLITFETAKLAKEMGFQLYTSFYYSEGMEIKGTKMGMHGNPNAYGGISAPTQSLLQKWLREEHRVNVVCLPNRYDSDVWYYFVGSSAISHEDTGYTYEEALEEGLVVALKLI